MYIKLISFILVFLVVCLPISFAQVTKEEELTAEEGFTSLIINVKKYEPTVIVSSLLEEQNIPVYAFLSAMPTEGLALPRIQSISVSVIGGNKSRLVGGARYHKPIVYDWNDMGYIEVKLKKIEKEKEMPDIIDIDLKAKVRYEGEATSALIGGVEYKNLTEESAIELGDVLGDRDFGFFGGKGYIVAERIRGKTATFVLYNGAGDYVSRFSVVEGKESGAFSLVKGSTRPEDYVRVRVDEVVDRSQPSVVITIDNIPHYANVGREILGWMITNVNARGKTVELRKGKYMAILTEGDYSNVRIEGEDLKRLVENWGTRFSVEKIGEGEKEEAIFNIGTVKEGEKLTENCELTKIESNYVDIISEKGRHTLYLRKEYEKERRTYYPTGETRYPDTLSSGICNGAIRLVDIDTKRSVKITLMTGKRRGYTESVFSLHLPVEKRPFDLSPRALDKKINKTRKQIENLNKKYINNLEKTVKEWRKICLVVTATMLVYTFFKGIFTKSPIQKEIKERESKIEEAIKGVNKVNVKGDWYKLNNYKDYEGNDIYVLGEDMTLFYTYDVKNRKYRPISNSVLYENGKPIYWSDEGGFKEYKGLDPNEFNRIHFTTIRDRNAIIIPLKNPDNILILKQQYSEWRIRHGEASKGLYAVVYDDSVEIWQGRGDKIDVRDDSKDVELDRQLSPTYSINEGIGLKLYRDLDAKYLRKLKTAKSEGRNVVDIKGDKYIVDSATRFLTSKVECKGVMDPWQCTILFNACDPVMCPPSRCNWNNEYDVKNVIQSGLIGSTYLCLPNSIVSGGKVLVPVCLTGILAGLKNIRSYYEGYEKCLINAKHEGQPTGICDQISSIFICEIVWKEMISFFNLKGGILGLITRKLLPSGGGEYFETPIETGMDKSKKALNFFVKDYATNIFAAYVGRSTEDIGTEVCKSSVAGKFPNLGEFMEEIAEPEDPVQATVYFEEHDYAPTLGQSRYKVYYHIYAGNPKMRETVDYKVYLHSKESDLLVDQGVLKAGEIADKSVDKIGKSGYPEVCFVLNGVSKCNFGKSVSTSFFMEQASKWYMKEVGGLAPKITKASQCVSEEQKVSTVGGYVPKAAIERVCAISNPYLGLGQYKEREWNVVGKCIDEKGRNLGLCWQRGDLTRYPELKEDVSSDICVNRGGEWCGKDETCEDGAIMFDFDDRDLGHRECCLGGKCVEKVEVKKEEPTGEEVEEKQFEQEGIIDPMIYEIKEAENCKVAEDLIEKYANEFKDIYHLSEAEYWVGYKCFYEDNYEKAKFYLLLVIGDYVDDAYYYLGLTYYRLGKLESDIDIKKAYYKKSIDFFDKLSDDITPSLFYSKEYATIALESKKDVEAELNKLLE